MGRSIGLDHKSWSWKCEFEMLPFPVIRFIHVELNVHVQLVQRRGPKVLWKPPLHAMHDARHEMETSPTHLGHAVTVILNAQASKRKDVPGHALHKVRVARNGGAHAHRKDVLLVRVALVNGHRQHLRLNGGHGAAEAVPNTNTPLPLVGEHEVRKGPGAWHLHAPGEQQLRQGRHGGLGHPSVEAPLVIQETNVDLHEALFRVLRPVRE
mmetsp:Transcript_112913/g.269037  ORF Transcript_112913/g.269037 Transcript_112913/m.269037 type:complete len:210 (+) Transcript_112913:174-803(+)